MEVHIDNISNNIYFCFKLSIKNISENDIYLVGGCCHSFVTQIHFPPIFYNNGCLMSRSIEQRYWEKYDYIKILPDSIFMDTLKQTKCPEHYTGEFYLIFKSIILNKKKQIISMGHNNESYSTLYNPKFCTDSVVSNTIILK